MKQKNDSVCGRDKRQDAGRWRLGKLLVRRFLLFYIVLLALPVLASSATPVVEWRMDKAGWLEPSNGQPSVDLLNASGAEPHGSWVNPSLAAAALDPAIPSLLGTCGYAQVDGRESYIDAGNPDLGLTNQVTVMAWMRWDIDPATGHQGASIVSMGSDSWRYDGQFWLQHHRWRNRFAFVVRTDRGTRRLTSPWQFRPIQGRWYHLTGVYDGEWMKLYVDGQLVRQRRHRGTFEYKDTYQLQSGRRNYRWWNYTWSGRYFEGALDEIRIYNEALSGADVQQAMGTRRPCLDAFANVQAPSPQPAMALHMDEPAWSGVAGEVIDSSDNAFHGVAVNGATTRREEPAIPGDMGTHAYGQFNGQKQYLDMESPHFDLDNQVTVMAWARWDIDPATGQRKMFLVSTSADNVFRKGPFQLLYWFPRSGKSRFVFTVRTDEKRRAVFSKTEPQQGEWYHLTGVYDGHHIRLYVDGLQEAMRPLRGEFTINQPARLAIGCMARKRSEAEPCYRGMLGGKADEVHIFRQALSPGEILVHKDAKRPGVSDPTPPEVALNDGDGIANSFQEGGFLLRGTVRDTNGITSMELILSGTSGERLRQTVDISASGHWAIWVDGSLLTAGEQLNITLEAVDGSGNRGTFTQTVTIAAADHRVRHFVNRATFGPTVTLLNTVNRLGLDTYRQQQLHPQSIDAQAFDAFIDGFEPVLTKADLQVYMLMRAIHSPRQLQEVMTAFWDNHFNTDINKHDNVDYEFYENRAFREHALGRFRNLLEISAKSPAMLIYLDAVSNLKGEPNENYARELMELHTMGVDGGYTQDDVEAAAKVFTGWQVREDAATFEDAFFFNAEQHDTSDKIILGVPIAGGGVEEGEAVLDLLARHPSTAAFICHKLAVWFVHDLPTDDLIFGCADVFLAASDMDDQMAQVVNYFFTTPEFNDADTYRSKIVTPLELVARTVRGLEAESEGGDLPGELRRLGQRLFEFPVPTGFGETGDDWINSNQLLERIRFVNRMAFNRPGGNRSTTDPLAFCRAHGYETAEGIVGFLFQLMFGTNPSALEHSMALDVLTDQGNETFDIAAADTGTKLRRLVGTMLSFPGYQYQ